MAVDDPAQFASAILLTAISLLSGFVTGALGFGYPLVATPLAVQVVDFKQVLALFAVPTLTVTLFSVFVGARPGEGLRRYWPMVPGNAVASVVGARLMLGADARWLLLGLAGLLLLYLQLPRLRGLHPSAIGRHPRLFAGLFGIAGGLSEGLVNASGPFLLIFFGIVGAPAAQFVPVMAVCFTFGRLGQLIGLWQGGALSTSVLGLALPLSAVAVAACWAGARIRSRMPPAAYDRWLRIALYAMAALLVWRFLRTA